MRGSQLMARRFFSSKPQRDFFYDLRLKVAKALTGSLNPDDVKSELLGSSFVPQEPVAAVAPPPAANSLSIAETIAAIREEEAQKHAAKWEREKDAIVQQAEAAVRARVESDLAVQQRKLAFEQWKANLEAEQKVPEETAVTTEEVKDEFETHPILGRCIADLGYKRLHLTPIQSLINIPVWEKQRTYRHERSIQMAKDKKKTPHLGLPGVMGIHENAHTGDLRILDGQHRIGMLAILDQQDDTPENLKKPVLVEVYPSADEKFPKDLFTEINRAEPVKLVDMPGMVKDSSRQILNDAAATLKDSYPDMFKASQRCRPPHLNIDNLRDALFAASVLDRHSIKNTGELVDWMRAENKRLKDEFQKEETRSKVPKKAMEKADAHQFYLGLESTWYYK